MAVTRVDCGWTLTAAGDIAAGTVAGERIRVLSVVIVKATAGTVTFKDGRAVTILLTGALADTSTTQIDFGGIELTGLEYDAVSAGTATVLVIGDVVR